MSDIEQKLREDVARAWASIDGKVDQFDLEKNNPNLAYDDPAYVGSYEGYMAEANELLKRSGVGPLIASLRANLESALTVSRAECEGLRAAGGDAEKALREAKDTLTDLDARLIECGALHTAEDAYDTSYRGSVLDALISIDIVLDTLPAALSQKETGHGA